jgi:hypothetical protein
VTATTESSSNTTTTADGTMNSTAESTTIYANGDKAESKTEAVSTADGASKETTTETMTTAEGVTTSKETVNATNAEGTSASKVTTVDENGDSKTVAEAAISQVALDAAAESGEPATLPIDIWATPADSEEEIPPVVTLTLPEGSSGGLVTIPVENMNISTVLVVTLADGTKQIINQSMMTEDGGLLFKLTDDMTVEVVDNHQDFDDIDKDDWCYDAFDYATSHGLINGVGDNKLDPTRTVTFDQAWTLLARSAGKQDNEGDAWNVMGQKYREEFGGTGNGAGGDNMSRKDMMGAIYTSKGGPEMEPDVVNDVLSGFDDLDGLSQEELQALAYTALTGMTKGKGNGKMDPSGTVQMSELCTWMQRLNEYNLKH